MAYFSNSTDGSAFDNQCARCRFFQAQCPIAAAQILHNYDQLTAEKAGYPQARKILSTLVADDGSCAMFNLSPKLFGVDPNQTSLFDE